LLRPLPRASGRGAGLRLLGRPRPFALGMIIAGPARSSRPLARQRLPFRLNRGGGREAQASVAGTQLGRFRRRLSRCQQFPGIVDGERAIKVLVDLHRRACITASLFARQELDAVWPKLHGIVGGHDALVLETQEVGP